MSKNLEKTIVSYYSAKTTSFFLPSQSIIRGFDGGGKPVLQIGSAIFQGNVKIIEDKINDTFFTHSFVGKVLTEGNPIHY